MARSRRIPAAEQALNGQPPSPDAFQAAAVAAAAAVDPMEDHNTSADYCRDLVATLTIHALERTSA